VTARSPLATSSPGGQVARKGGHTPTPNMRFSHMRFGWLLIRVKPGNIAGSHANEPGFTGRTRPNPDFDTHSTFDLPQGMP